MRRTVSQDGDHHDAGVRALPQSTVGEWLRPTSGVVVIPGATWTSDGSATGVVVVPDGGAWETVSASHRGLTHVRWFSRLRTVSPAELPAAIAGFASEYGLLAPLRQLGTARLSDGRTVAAEAIADWSSAAATIGHLLDVIECARELELSPVRSEPRRRLETHLQELVSWSNSDGQTSVDGQDGQEIVFPPQETVTFAPEGTSSDVVLLRIARHGVAQRVTRGLTGRLRPNIGGFDVRDLLPRRRASRCITYVSDSLLGTLYHQLAFALVGTAGRLNNCVVCGREFGATRRDARYCGDACRSRHSYPSTNRFRERART